MKPNSNDNDKNNNNIRHNVFKLKRKYRKNTIKKETKQIMDTLQHERLKRHLDGTEPKRTWAPRIEQDIDVIGLGVSVLLVLALLILVGGLDEEVVPAHDCIRRCAYFEMGHLILYPEKLEGPDWVPQSRHAGHRNHRAFALERLSA